MYYPGAAVSGLIAAPVEAVWELVSDPQRHVELAGSGEVRAVTVRDQAPIGPGAIFESRQVMRGIRYVTANKIVLWDPPYRFGWRVGFTFAPGIAQAWVFVLRPEAGATRVINGVADIYALPNIPPFTALADEIGRREASVIVPTLDRIAAALGAPPPSDVTIERRPPAEAIMALPKPGIQAALWAVVGLGLMWLGRTIRRG